MKRDRPELLGPRLLRWEGSIFGNDSPQGFMRPDEVRAEGVYNCDGQTPARIDGIVEMVAVRSIRDPTNHTKIARRVVLIESTSDRRTSIRNGGWQVQVPVEVSGALF